MSDDFRWVCPEHGPTRIDETGCCVTCGVDCDEIRTVRIATLEAKLAAAEKDILWCIANCYRLPDRLSPTKTGPAVWEKTLLEGVREVRLEGDAARAAEEKT